MGKKAIEQDNPKPLEERFEECRPVILWSELAALLHDIGKLSKAFLDYRKSWHADPRGWDNDPHENKFLDRDEVYKRYPGLEEFFTKTIKDTRSGMESLSIKSAVHNHVRPPKNDLLLNFLKAADSIDAAQDRNNPLFSAEQSDRSKPREVQDNLVFKSNVYGYEGMETFIDADAVEAEREKLYKGLSEPLKGYYKGPTWETRQEIFESIQDAFSITVSDTTRPANDTTLWEHSYAVATITKVILAHKIIYGKDLDRFQKVFFGILGIGWDGLRFMSRGHKIGDIVAREGLLAKVRKEIRQIIEHEVPIGNFIYEDLNGIYFLVPATEQPLWTEGHDLCSEEGKKRYLKLLDDLKDKILKEAADLSDGELCPHVSMPGGTTFVTSILNSIREIKERARVPFTGECQAALGRLQEDFQKRPGLVICPVCQKRPVKDMERYPSICESCLERRKKAQEGARARSETLFLEEISDSNRRVALILGHFGLDNWLGGTSIRSLFTSPCQVISNEVKDLGNTVQFKAEELRRQNFLKKKYPASWADYSYERIKDEISLCLRCLSEGGCSAEEREYAQNVLFLYDRRNARLDELTEKRLKEIADKWDSFLKEAKREYPERRIGDDDLLINILLAKTPTPSTILDAWRTTEDFFNSLSPGDAEGGICQLLKERKRTVIEVKRLSGPSLDRLYEGAVYQGRINGQRLDLVRVGKEKRFLVINKRYSKDYDKWKGKAVEITASDIGQAFKEPLKMEIEGVASESYLPLRTITRTPVLFMALVPANRAIAVTRFISGQYYKRLGKVIGRLPLSIGNIFFKEKTPMFVVLDAARRMVENFESLSREKGPETFLVTDAPSSLERRVSNSMPFKLTSTRDQRSIGWEVPVFLGDCSRDFFHPYLVLDDQQQDSCGPLVEGRPSLLPSISGPAVHVTDVQKGDTVHIYPNYYDFEFLDVTTRRFDIIMAEGQNRRIDPTTGRQGTKPYLLEQLPDIQALWAKLCSLPGLTDTRLRNIQTLLETKRLEWRQWQGDRCRPYEELVTSVIQKEFGYTTEDPDLAFFKKSILNGLWFDCLELYLKILKKRVKEKNDV